MKLVTRSQLGWPASAAPAQAKTKGVKVHYEGSAVSTRLLTDHNACIAEWKAIRKSHLANKAENYSDVAYNYAACPHGYLLEGRGLGKRTGANGNQALNQAHYAIVALIGSSGLTEPTDAMLHAIRDGIELLRKHGAGNEIKGHRDGYATACPGGPLYAWAQKGAPRPEEEPEAAPEKPAQPGKAKPVVSLRRLVEAARKDPALPQGKGSHPADVKPVEAALDKLDFLSPEYAKDGSFGSLTVSAYARYQRSLGYSGKDADGIPGESSLRKLASRTGLFTIST
ncbi:N-acetylmuramoyl-L-alanine amidase [Streptomyces sp. CO7]